MGPADSRRISRAPRYSGYCSASSKIHIPGCHRLWPFFPKRSISLTSCLCCSPTTPMLPKQHRFGLFRFRSPLLTESLLFSSPMGTEMFQFPTFAPCYMVTGLQPAGLPHSEIKGSRIICIYPLLIAAYHVLRRLREPRHPPSALVLLSSFHKLLAVYGSIYF